MALITTPKTTIKFSDFDFMATSANINRYLQSVGLYDDNGKPRINMTKIPNLFYFALAREIDHGYHYMTYHTEEQYPAVQAMIEEAFYKTMPRIRIAWKIYEPELYGVDFADMWNYSVDNTFTHGKKTVTEHGGTKTVSGNDSFSGASGGNTYGMDEDAPINSDITSITTPASKSKTSSDANSSGERNISNTETRNLTDTENNSGSDSEKRTEKRTYANTNNAANFFKYFVDGGKDIISIIHDCCRFMVYEYNIPLF